MHCVVVVVFFFYIGGGDLCSVVYVLCVCVCVCVCVCLFTCVCVHGARKSPRKRVKKKEKLTWKSPH